MNLYSTPLLNLFSITWTFFNNVLLIAGVMTLQTLIASRLRDSVWIHPCVTRKTRLKGNEGQKVLNREGEVNLLQVNFASVFVNRHLGDDVVTLREVGFDLLWYLGRQLFSSSQQVFCSPLYTCLVTRNKHE